jgi:hypothetical protein
MNHDAQPRVAVQPQQRTHSYDKHVVRQGVHCLADGARGARFQRGVVCWVKAAHRLPVHLPPTHDMQ